MSSNFLCFTTEEPPSKEMVEERVGRDGPIVASEDKEVCVQTLSEEFMEESAAPALKRRDVNLNLLFPGSLA